MSRLDAPSSTRSSAPAPANERPGRVLVVDDDIAVRFRVRDLLEASGGCEVIEAGSGQEALAAVAHRPPDIILLDLMMPGMSGLEVCVRLRHDAATREIPIIVLSAAHETDARPAALDAGAEDFLPKPIPARELRAKVATIMRLNRYHALRQERERMRWLFEHSGDPLVRISRDGRLRDVNLQARAILELPGPSDHAPDLDAAAVDAVALITRRHRPDPSDIFDRLRAGAELPDTGFTLNRPESSLDAARWFHVQLQYDEDNPAGDILLKFSDRSEAVRRQVETWSFQKLVSHKLRTPVNGVGPVLDLVLDDPVMLRSAEARELVGTARESARRLEDTIASILRYHDALCGAPSAAESAPVAWGELLRAVVKEAGLVSSLVIDGDDTHPLPPRLVEPMRVVLDELVDNYLKFSHVPTRGLFARFRRAPDAPPVLRLFAPGPPISPETLARLGSPYWQHEKRFTGEVPGAGLGLATCRLLLGSLGADLAFASDDTPVGLVSTITLPPAS